MQGGRSDFREPLAACGCSTNLSVGTGATLASCRQRASCWCGTTPSARRGRASCGVTHYRATGARTVYGVLGLAPSWSHPTRGEACSVAAGPARLRGWPATRQGSRRDAGRGGSAAPQPREGQPRTGRGAAQFAPSKPAGATPHHAAGLKRWRGSQRLTRPRAPGARGPSLCSTPGGQTAELGRTLTLGAGR